MLVDTHAHITEDEYDNLHEIITEMSPNIIFIVGTNMETNKNILKLVDEYDNVYGMIGIHPQFVDEYDEEVEKFLQKNIQNNKIIGIGEIGLDLHYGQINIDKQVEVFEKQIQIAKDNNKAVSIHSRDVDEIMMKTLKKMNDDNFKAVIHCFSSSLELAKEYVKMGIKIGVGGVITFKNSKEIKRVVSNIDLEHIVLETDSPYLSPEPYRGKKNKPSYIIETAKAVAEIKGKTLEEVANSTSKNAFATFGIEREI